MSPAPAMPCTNVANSSGAMIDLIMRKKILLKMAMFMPTWGKNWPTRIPATRPMTIQLVNEIRLKTPIYLAPHLSLARRTSKYSMCGGRINITFVLELRHSTWSPFSRCWPTCPSTVKYGAESSRTSTLITASPDTNTGRFVSICGQIGVRHNVSTDGKMIGPASRK